MKESYTNTKTVGRISLIILIALGLFGFSQVANPVSKTAPTIEYGVFVMPTKIFLENGRVIILEPGTAFVSCEAMGDFSDGPYSTIYLNPVEPTPNADYCYRIFNDDFED